MSKITHTIKKVVKYNDSCGIGFDLIETQLKITDEKLQLEKNKELEQLNPDVLIHQTSLDGHFIYQDFSKLLPIRVQINRRHKDPENTKRVCRPSKFGNKFKVGQVANFDGIETILADHLQYAKIPIPNNAVAVELFERYQLPQMDCSELKGKNLGCYCKLDQPCHADSILLKANFKQ